MKEEWWNRPVCWLCDYGSWIGLVLLVGVGSLFAYRHFTATSVETSQITLIWNNANDLDLRVMTPMSEMIYFAHPRGQEGGVFGQDGNANCRNTTTTPQERIRWLEGDLPMGEYQVWVDYSRQCALVATTPFTVTVTMGLASETYTGQLVQPTSSSLVTSIVHQQEQADE